MEQTTITVHMQDKLKFIDLMAKYRKIKFTLTQSQLFGIMVKVMKEYDPEIKQEVEKLK